jgi:CheY-like chemotaxis protein
LLEATPAGTPPARSLSQISAAADRAARFVRQLLLFSRKQILQPRLLDLNEVLTNLEPMLGRLLSEPIALETHYAACLPSVEADVGMIEQVVMNLAVNARDAMPKGGRLRLATAAATVDAAGARAHAEAREGRFVCLTVADTGCGMDRVVLDRIFEPFFTTKDIGKGTGLGLATVYGIVKQHQGWVEVCSEPGRGSTFRAYFPAAAARSNSADEHTSNVPAVRGGTETILLVEDEPLVREMVRTVLSQYHYHILEAGDGVEALEVWERHQGRIDLIVTDMVMPAGMSGRELADRLWKRQPDLKVLFTSGYSPDIVDTNIGADDTRFISKPYHPEQLAQRVRHCLDTPAQKGNAAACVLTPARREAGHTRTMQLTSV